MTYYVDLFNKDEIELLTLQNLQVASQTLSKTTSRLPTIFTRCRNTENENN